MAVRNTLSRLAFAALGTAAIMGLATGVAQAGNITFNFAGLTNNGQTLGVNSDSSVTTYMDTQLHNTANGGNAAWNVTVTGAESSGASGGTATAAGYNADGHVICKSATGSCVPDTLATKDNTPFIMNSGAYTVGSGGIAGTGTQYANDQAIKMVFAGSAQAPVKMNSISFDYEIFPDGTCASGPCNPEPDFNFVLLNGSGAVVENVTESAVMPGSAGASQGTNKNSLVLNPETAPQLIGTITLSFAAVSNPTLYFIDWPAEIGVTNITFGVPNVSVPEPASLLLFGAGLLGVGAVRRRKARAAAAA